MREIKLRAWDSKEKRMWRVLRYTFEGHPTITVQFNPIIKKWHEEYIVMQYTGLHDRNGKEICEGDIYIVKSLHDGDECIWNNDKQEGIPQAITWDGKHCCFDFGLGSRIIYNPYDFEVIGNIYENPELLNPIPPNK